MIHPPPKVKLYELAEMLGIRQDVAFFAAMRLFDRGYIEMYLQSDTGNVNHILEGFPEGSEYEWLIAVNKKIEGEHD